MAREQAPNRRPAPLDVRLRGFADRASVDEVIAWLDVQGIAPVEELVPVADAHRRVLARSVSAPEDVPPNGRAVIDGYALRAAETIGAGDYNPLTFILQNPDGQLPTGSAALVSAGGRLPRGADAILPFEAAQARGTVLEVFGSVAEGAGTERRGEQARAGQVLLAVGQALRPQECALLTAFGIGEVPVLSRPRVRLIVAGPKQGADLGGDADGCLLQLLVGRDGGMIEGSILRSIERDEVNTALSAPGADIILMVGRTGTGVDDESALLLAQAGALVFHGIALRPGGSAGMGLVGAVPAILLPGDPFACWCVYEILAGRLVRRLAGRRAELPHAIVEVPLRHKIISSPGVVDICPIRFVEGLAEPTGVADFETLASAASADGFVIVPAPLEGYGAGVRVAVHCYDRA